MIVYKEHEQGTTTKVHDLDNKIVIEKSFDAEPLVEQCAAERQATSGQRWGDGQKIGTIPAAVYGQFMRDYQGKELTQKLMQWLRENPAFITFDKFK